MGVLLVASLFYAIGYKKHLTFDPRFLHTVFARSFKGPGMLQPDERELHEFAFMKDREQTLLRYLLWRRGTIVLIWPMLFISFVFSMIETGNAAFGTGMHRAQVLFAINAGAKMIISFFTLVTTAAALWTSCNWKHSFRWLFAAWIAPFVYVFVLFILPFAMVTGISSVDTVQDFLTCLGSNPSLAQMAAPIISLLGRFAYAIMALSEIAPLAIALLPGVLRGAVVIKIMIENSIWVGWMVVCVPMFYTPIVVGILLVLYQLFINGLVLMSAGFLIASQAIYILSWKHLTKPKDNAAAYIAKVRLISMLLLFLCAGSFLIFVFTDSLTRDVIHISALSIVQFLASFIGKFFMASLLAADCILGVLISVRKSEREDKAKHKDVKRFLNYAAEITTEHTNSNGDSRNERDIESTGEEIPTLKMETISENEQDEEDGREIEPMIQDDEK